MENQYSKFPSYCCQGCGECVGYLGRLFMPFIHKCHKKPKTTPILCRLFGHKFKERVVKYNPPTSGFGISATERSGVDVVYSKNLDLCKRCKEPKTLDTKKDSK